MMKIDLKDLARVAGSSLVATGIFTCFGSVGSSVINAPNGHFLGYFTRDFMLRTSKDVFPMFTWSVVGGIISESIKGRIKNPKVNRYVAGALTGAVLEVRNGYQPMFFGACSGIGRTFQMNLFNLVERTLTSPLKSHLEKRRMENFVARREQTLMVSPFEAIRKLYRGNF